MVRTKHGLQASPLNVKQDLTATSAPKLKAYLHAAGLDVSYCRALADKLYYISATGEEVQVLDLVGGYGTLLLGHNHPELRNTMIQFLSECGPIHAQGSLRSASEMFAEQLAQRIGEPCHVVFSSTGAEAVESAMKHAMLETGGNTFITLEGGFHGKSLATIGLASHVTHREPFEELGVHLTQVSRVRLNDIQHLEHVFSEFCSTASDGSFQQICDQPSTFAPRLAGFLFEPIQGEGGVHLMTKEFALRAAELCRQYRIPMIADECQTGLGRTGTFLACERLGVQPDYIIFSKALGGGLVKIAALAVRRSRYRDEMDLKHTSTFGGDELSCRVASRVLDLVSDSFLKSVCQLGQQWKTALESLLISYPDIITDVRGEGLMLAIELRPLTSSPSFLLRMLSATEDLGILAAGYLLQNHRIRVATTLSCPNTIRIQPAAISDEASIEQTLLAFRNLCQLIREAAAPELSSHLVLSSHSFDTSTFVSSPDCGEGSRAEMRAPATIRSGFQIFSDHPISLTRCRSERPTQSQSERRIGWLCHMIDNTDLARLDPSFVRVAADDREFLLHRLSPLANPAILSEVRIESATGDSVWLYPILLPVTSAWMKRCMEQGAAKTAVSLVQKGLDLAHHLGCSLTALGQYTSIVTSAGLRANGHGMGLCTGNTYALALALEAIRKSMQDRQIDSAVTTCAVIGAAGNIGETAARILAPLFAQTLLVGSDRPGSEERLQNLAGSIPRSSIARDLKELSSAQVVLAAANAVDRPFDRRLFASNAVLCDLSVPTVFSAQASNLNELAANPVIQGGIARLPSGEDLGIVGFPLEAGEVYGCMGEALLLGFENITDHRFIGKLQPDHVHLLEALGQKHGFRMTRFKEECVLGTRARELQNATGN